ncbi:MAG: alpha/beta hydrolase [Alphaproteobacteria bacterium]|nr:alpha/beta hydrolase [Alphaproteobacteria bacterium]
MTSKINIICVAGFGDDKSLFAPLLDDKYSRDFNIFPVDLPGFGVEAAGYEITLNGLAEYLLAVALEQNAHYIMAHSVASIIATLAAEKSDGFITHIISLEGNLTAADAYFSGKAADFKTAEEFKRSFPKILGKGAETDPLLKRYLGIVMTRNARDLWSLGCDARTFSEENDVGARLINSAKVFYLYNSKNCPADTLEWLDNNPLDKYELINSSHSAPLDSADEMMAAIQRQLA